MINKHELKTFTSRYSVNDLGSFYDSKEEHYISPLKDKYGNKVVALLDKDHISIQRVDKAVAKLFLDNPLDSDAIQHKDKNKWNCSVSNLVWFNPARYNKNKSTNKKKSFMHDDDKPEDEVSYFNKEYRDIVVN